MKMKHLVRKVAEGAIVSGLSFALVLGSAQPALAMDIAMQTDLSINSDTQHSALIELKAKQVQQVTQTIDYSGVSNFYTNTDRILGYLPFDKSMFSDSAMPTYRAYLELIAQGKEGDISAPIGGAKRHVRANLETRDPDWSNNALNGITVDTNGNSNVNGFNLPPITREKAMELAKSVLDQAGDDNAKLRQLFLEALKVSGKAAKENPGPADIDKNAPLEMSFSVTQSVKPEDRPYLEIGTPDAKSIKDTSGGIFELKNVTVEDTDQDGRNDTMHASIVYTGAAKTQWDIYQQFIGMNVLAKDGKLKDDILSFTTPVYVAENVPDGTELTLTSNVSGNTTYLLYEDNTEDPQTAEGKELQDFWLCYLSLDFLETVQGGNQALNFVQSEDGKDSTLSADDAVISITGKVVPRDELRVTAHYVDADTGKDLVDPVVTKAYEFDDYVTEAKDIAGYSLIETPDNAKGTLESDSIELVYLYKKNQEQKPQPGDKDSDETKLEQGGTGSKDAQKTLAKAKPSRKALPKTGDLSVAASFATGLSAGLGVIALAIKKRIK